MKGTKYYFSQHRQTLGTNPAKPCGVNYLQDLQLLPQLYFVLSCPRQIQYLLCFTLNHQKKLADKLGQRIRWEDSHFPEITICGATKEPRLQQMINVGLYRQPVVTNSKPIISNNE